MNSVPRDPYEPLPNTTTYESTPAQAFTTQANSSSELPPSLQAAPNRQQESSVPQEQEENPFADHYTSTYSPPTNGYGGATQPYHPGYESTPSYMQRQESSANNLTMHGASPVQEEDGRQRPQTPEYNATRPQPHDVSPIAERSTVTYRY